MKYFCCEENRRAGLRLPAATLNGIDYLEVVDNEEPSKPEKQRKLRIFFVNSKGVSARFNPFQLSNRDLVQITGGERIKKIVVDSVTWVTDHLEAHVTPRGDFSTYTLALIEPNTRTPLKELDPQLASIDFSFKVECPSDFDCAPVCDCPPEVRSEPELDYLAKDYTSFRQLILDRLSLLVPGWRERNAADLGITLVELLAYVGDYLSYRQDAIATEAYLGTARQRVSVKRHARLLDYPMHEGSNARVWVQVLLKNRPETQKGVKLFPVLRKKGGVFTPPGSGEKLVPGEDLNLRLTRFTTFVQKSPILPGDPVELGRLLSETDPAVFEPVEDAELFADHNEIQFYTWSDANCCLPRGATKATLAGHHPNLKVGMVLVLAEVLGPLTGNKADADKQRRHAVRLTKAQAFDSASARLKDPVTASEITEIEWAEEDALPFPLCISSVLEEGPNRGQNLANVSVAWGNIILADHGMTMLASEAIGAVPEPNPALAPVTETGCDHCGEAPERLAPVRFRPRLKSPGVTFREVFRKETEASAQEIDLFNKEFFPAAQAFDLDPRRASAAVILGASGQLWEPERDLLGSEAFDRHFVVEMGNDGGAAIRFGEDINGMQPSSGTEFYALYRIGGGAAGNIGAESLTQISVPALFQLDGTPLGLATGDVVQGVTNPLAAHGGTDPESLEEVRQYAPQAFRTAERCVTPQDYADRASQNPEVQRAAATIRWTGSWHTIFLTVDRRGGKSVDTSFEQKLRQWLEPFRLAGHDLEIQAPQFVSIELQLFICVASGFFRNDVKRAVEDVFSAVQRPDGSRGFFHPDEWTFGQPVLVSKIYAAAQKVTGVRHVDVKILRKQNSTATTVPNALVMGRLEVARLENDPNFPDHGRLEIQTAGGQ
jgi:hypothetical protein